MTVILRHDSLNSIAYGLPSCADEGEHNFSKKSEKSEKSVLKCFLSIFTVNQ